MPAPFAARVIAWQRAHGRHDLPWQGTRDAYRIWLSEIMLQQTQVATALPYYERFLASFPDVAALAAAPLERVLEHWSGLGYYRRARQLHAAARQIVSDHGGQFPRDLDAARRLPGVGRYTAGAILSIAFDRREPILEANTLRLWSRLAAYRGDPRRGAGQQLLWAAARRSLPLRSVGAFNQALMELGAEVCRARQPACDACPVSEYCEARRLGIEQELPVSAPKPLIESVREAAVVARGHRVASSVKLAMVVPGSGLVKAAAEREGLDRVFRDAGFEWREPGCSMCLAMNDDRLEPGERCASTSNRNFEGRQGAGGRTHLVSPAMAVAAAIAGHFVDVRRLS